MHTILQVNLQQAMQKARGCVKQWLLLICTQSHQLQVLRKSENEENKLFGKYIHNQTR